ncbi:MAG TPA: thioesterase family protein [Solirubrobacteraceae bacterium]|jgi:acyl-CoA thioester hydrolase|nr:thioesterase family protein [Solirubrobacteraceae bacterium]
MSEFRHRLRVRYGECDPQGVVYFARYADFVDVAITELWRARIRPYGEMVDGGSDMVVAELTLRYRGSARFDDELDVVVAVDRLGETSLTCAVRIERDGSTLVEGTIRQVCIDPATKAKKPLPGDVRAALA